MFHAFYADPHFGHKRICAYANRPFNSIKEMHEEFIERYNQLVKPSHSCLWLGDAFLCPRQVAQSILVRMNGLKAIIRGNHDKPASWLTSVGFDFVVGGPINLRIAGIPTRASHYPYKYKNDPHESKLRELYPSEHKGEILLHGHTHSKTSVFGRQIHVGVDAWNYWPALFTEIVDLIEHIKMGGL